MSSMPPPWLHPGAARLPWTGRCTRVTGQRHLLLQGTCLMLLFPPPVPLPGMRSVAATLGLGPGGGAAVGKEPRLGPAADPTLSPSTCTGPTARPFFPALCPSGLLASPPATGSQALRPKGSDCRQCGDRPQARIRRTHLNSPLNI